MRDEINYAALIDSAMHSIVKEALRIAAVEGLPGNHHFFISFMTKFPGVVLSERLRQRYPEEMTIVLQHQFDQLEVFEDRFAVGLSFDNIPEKVIVPFLALTAFADPSVKFGLQFRHIDMFTHQQENNDDRTENQFLKNTMGAGGLYQEVIASQGETEILCEIGVDSSFMVTTEAATENNVVRLDAFRKKQDAAKT